MSNKRQSKRKPVNLEIEILAGEDSYKGNTKNISSDGLLVQFTIDFQKDINTFRRSSKLVVKLEYPSGESSELSCEARWMMFTDKRSGRIIQLGLLVIDPDQQLKAFADSLP